ncbi:MAG: DUF4250 domain-containing protein [Butyrivibrio sp.]
MIPSDPVILLSYVNTKLRDECRSLDDFCDKYEVDKASVTAALKSIQYTYNPNTNKFE